MAPFLQSLFNGLLAGCIYALFAMGLTMVYRVLNFVNFAHGELITWGAYLLYLFMGGPFHLPLWIALLPALGGTIVLGLGMDRIVFSPLRQANRLTLLIAALGTSFFLRNGAQLLWGAELRTYGFEIKPGWKVLHVSITVNQLAILLATILCLIAVYLVLYRSTIGKSMRAVSDNLELARVTGINTHRTIRFTWVLASTLACIGGILLALDTNLQPGMGMINLVKAFAAILLGGVGNIWGALLGGLSIGLAENLGVLFLSPGYKDSIAFCIMVILLLLKPSVLKGSNP